MVDSFTQEKLIKRWFYNLINGIKNEEILLLHYSYRNVKNIDFEYSKFKEKLELKIKFLEPKDTYKILDFSLFDNINTIQNNENTILISVLPNNINKLKNCNHRVIYSHINYEIYNTIFGLEKTLQLNYIDSTINSNYTIIFKSENPINLIQQSSELIYNLIFSLFNSDIFYNYNVLKSNVSTENIIWIEQIKEEIYLLTFHNILTSKLAIAIYKICTFRFNETNTSIGKFYYEKLGIRSKIMHLPNVYGGRKPMITKKAKVYNLNLSPYINNQVYLHRKKKRVV